MSNPRKNTTQAKNQGVFGSLLGEPTAAKTSGLAFSLAAVLPTGLSLIFLICVHIFGLNRTENYMQKDWYTYAGFLITPIAFALIAVWCLYWTKTPLKEAVSSQRCSWKYYVIAIVLQIGLFSLSQLNTWFLEFLGRFGYQPNEISLPSMDGFGLVGVLFAVAVLPALFEEIIFRGILLGGLKAFGSVGAVLLCGGLFALYHQSPEQTLYQFACGAAFALVAVRAKSIFPTVVAHFLNNSVIILLAKFGVDTFSAPVLITIMAVSVLCLIGSLVYLCFFDKNQEDKQAQQKQERVRFFVCAAVGLLICSLTWVSVLLMGFTGG